MAVGNPGRTYWRKKQKTDEENFVPKTTLDSKTQISEEYYGVIDKRNSKVSNFCVTSETFMENRKRNVLNDIYRTYPKNAYKRWKSALSKTSEGIISTSIMQRGINYDSGIDINSPIRNELENVHFTEICSGLECHSEKQGVQNLNYFENKILLTSEQNNLDKSDSNASNKKIKFSIDYILAIPGPSNKYENISQLNFSEQNIEDRTTSIEQTPQERKDSSMSLGCKRKEISGHIEVHEGKDLYLYCQREYKKVDEVYRLRQYYSHTNEHTCDVCRKAFECLSKLEDHYLDHEYYHLGFCRICKSDIDEHRAESKWKGKFKCCYQECTYENNRSYPFKRHLYTHSILKLFKCKFCGKRFRQQATLCTHSKTHVKCEIGGKTFVDGYSLDSNYSEH